MMENIGEDESEYAQDLIDAGIKPSKSFSEYLEYAHKLRLAGIEKTSALKQTLSYARKKEKEK